MKKDDRIKDLKEEVKDLKREAVYREKEFKVREKEIHENEREKRNDVVRSKEKALARAEELQKRIDESPYSQLQDILKALVVKLPTLDIKEISVHGKGK